MKNKPQPRIAVGRDSDVPIEPNNQQLEDDTWQQPPFDRFPAHTVSVTVPQGVFAQLAWARVGFVELSAEEVEAYKKVSESIVPASDFAMQGDMSPFVAERLAVAEASKVFTRISACIPPTRLSGKLDATIIGCIETIGGDRYFVINVPTVDTMGVQDVATRARRRKLFGLLIVLIGLALVVIVPPVLVLVTHDESWFLGWLFGACVVLSMVVLAYIDGVW